MHNTHLFPLSRPTLVLGLVGFAHDEREHIESQLGLAPVGGVRWRVDGFVEADAWLVNGARTRMLADDELCVDPPLPDLAPVRFWLPEVDRPIAFSQPLACTDFDPACTFDLASTSSLVIALAKFSQWLRPRAMLLALADLLTQRAARTRLKNRVYHLMVDNRLVAVVDLAGDVGVLPEATLGELSRASWIARPAAAGYVPEKFARRSMRELLWEFAGRTQRDLLPTPYREVPIYLKRAPMLAQRLLGDAQLFVLRELTKAPRTFAQLCASDRFSANEIARALTAFYLVGAITSSPPRPVPSRTENSSAWPWWVSQQADDAANAQHFTAPGALAMPR